MRPFRPTPLMPKPILAKRTSDGVERWYEGEAIRSLYRPGDVGFEKWAALADEQAKEAKAA